MFKTILVAIDRSDTNDRVFEEAIFLAKTTLAKIILIHVLSPEEPNSPVISFPNPTEETKDNYHYTDLAPEVTQMANQIYRQQWKTFKNQGWNILSSFANIAIFQGIETEFTQITGHPCSTICEFARSCRADAIVIGRKGHSKARETLLGSVSNYVVHHAPCSVLLVQTPVEEQYQSSVTLKSNVYV